jgi:mannose-6-phosphate isomerase-like protein (cupin superfamily)
MSATITTGEGLGLRSGRAPFGEPSDSYIRVDAGAADVREMNRLVRRGVRISNEQLDGDAHLNEVIPKPWGHEYRAYVDDFFDLWVLHLDAGGSTSMHMHPRKLTYLICLRGHGLMTRFGMEIDVRAGAVLRIAPGAFHATRNVGDEQLDLIEVELPRNKFDLIRLRDNYNRAETSYEEHSLATPDRPLRRVPYLPNAYMRDQTPNGRYAFDIRAGMDIFYRRPEADLFYIPLCVSGVVYSDVDILARRADEARDPASDKYYLSVSKAS